MAKQPVPARISAKPDPDQWGDSDLLTLKEAAALMWPEGPLTERSLRHAVRIGKLPISVVAGKFLTTKMALRALSNCAPRTAAGIGRSIDQAVMEADKMALKRLRS